jgi:hypothetical protein
VDAFFALSTSHETCAIQRTTCPAWYLEIVFSRCFILESAVGAAFQIARRSRR